MALTSSTYVLSLGTLGWSEFSKMDVKSVQTLSGAKRADNINLILNNSSPGALKKYPHTTNYTTEDGWFKSKKFPLRRNAKVRKFYLEFEHDMTTDPIPLPIEVTVTLRVYNIKFGGGWEEVIITDLESGKWRGLASGLKGDYLEVTVKNAKNVKKMRIEIREVE